MKKIAIVALLSAFVATPAVADGLYAALDVGQSKGSDACNNGLPGCKDTGTLIRGAIGTQITPMWGAEVSYGTYGKESLGVFFGVPLDWEASGLQVSGTGTFPLGDAFSLIGKLGIARTDLKFSGGGASVSETSINLAFGIGAQYDFAKNIAIRAQYEDLGTVGNANTTGTAKITLLSAGVVVKF